MVPCRRAKALARAQGWPICPTGAVCTGQRDITFLVGRPAERVRTSLPQPSGRSVPSWRAAHSSARSANRPRSRASSRSRVVIRLRSVWRWMPSCLAAGSQAPLCSSQTPAEAIRSDRSASRTCRERLQHPPGDAGTAGGLEQAEHPLGDQILEADERAIGAGPVGRPLGLAQPRRQLGPVDRGRAARVRAGAAQDRRQIGQILVVADDDQAVLVLGEEHPVRVPFRVQPQLGDQRGPRWRLGGRADPDRRSGEPATELFRRSDPPPRTRRPASAAASPTAGDAEPRRSPGSGRGRCWPARSRWSPGRARPRSTGSGCRPPAPPAGRRAGRGSAG